MLCFCGSRLGRGITLGWLVADLQCSVDESLLRCWRIVKAIPLYRECSPLRYQGSLSTEGLLLRCRSGLVKELDLEVALHFS